MADLKASWKAFTKKYPEIAKSGSGLEGTINDYVKAYPALLQEGRDYAEKVKKFSNLAKELSVSLAKLKAAAKGNSEAAAELAIVERQIGEPDKRIEDTVNVIAKEAEKVPAI